MSRKRLVGRHPVVFFGALKRMVSHRGVELMRESGGVLPERGDGLEPGSPGQRLGRPRYRRQAGTGGSDHLPERQPMRDAIERPWDIVRPPKDYV